MALNILTAKPKLPLQQKRLPPLLWKDAYKELNYFYCNQREQDEENERFASSKEEEQEDKKSDNNENKNDQEILINANKINSTLPKSFSEIKGINPTIARLLSKYTKTDKPTICQQLSIPPIISGHNTYVAARTSGSGVTLGLLAACMSRIDVSQKSTTQILYFLPAREMAWQTNSMFNDILAPMMDEFLEEDEEEEEQTEENDAQGKKKQQAFFVSAQNSATAETPFSMCVFGGTPLRGTIDSLKKRNHGVPILFATCGRAYDLMQRGALLVHQVRMVVFEEFDRLLDIGFADMMCDIVQEVKHQVTRFYEEEETVSNNKNNKKKNYFSGYLFEKSFYRKHPNPFQSCQLVFSGFIPLKQNYGREKYQQQEQQQEKFVHAPTIENRTYRCDQLDAANDLIRLTFPISKDEIRNQIFKNTVDDSNSATATATATSSSSSSAQSNPFLDIDLDRDNIGGSFLMDNIICCCWDDRDVR